MPKAASLFAGVDSEIDRLLGIPDNPKYGQTLPRFGYKAAAYLLSKETSTSEASAIVSRVYDLLEGNWKSPPYKPSPKLWVSRMTWSWSPDFKAFEVPLERAVVSLFRFQGLINAKGVSSPLWFNQIPVAAGLVSAADGKRCIDLVYRKNTGIYDFVELKYARLEHGGDTPLGAAMQILKHAAAYLLVRAKRGELEKNGWKPEIVDSFLTGDGQKLKAKATPTELLDATEVTLCVLAPSSFYAKFELGWLSTEINRGLESLIASGRFGRLKVLRFQFEHFNTANLFQPSGGNGFKFDFTRCVLPAKWTDLAAKDVAPALG